MHEDARSYYDSLKAFLDSITVTDKKSKNIPFLQGIEIVCKLIIDHIIPNNKIMFIGNGASAAISSHIATDFLKNGRIRAIAFNDSTLLTCISNDIGYEHVFEKPIEMFADEGDVLFAISSSGRSENVLRGVRAARTRKCRVITLSGFDSDNPLFLLGDINFYVPAQSYGPVEIIHHSICHCILDVIMKKRS